VARLATASITNEAADDLGYKLGLDAAALAKASDVMIGIEL
jgi:molybdopterin-binding protein